ncbi:uncharacterized protein LOC135680814 [Rhopilema esculentum]|uniref:uncharacterized protein LOC135680814 n=1 Tax=Rhopilema esculentum TaxID=499914 RepID=UPI0031D2AD39
MEDQEMNVTLQNKNFWNGSGHKHLNNVGNSEKLQGIVADGAGKCNDAGSRAEGSVRGERNKIITAEDFLPVLVGVWVKMSPEIRHAYKILREILSDKTKSVIEPFLSAVNPDEYPDYYEVIKEPMDLFKISEKFHAMQYSSITEMVADIRQIIENCYKYNGVDAFISKQAHKLEVILEQKLNLLSRELRNKTTIAATNEVRNKEYLNSLLFTSGKYLFCNSWALTSFDNLRLKQNKTRNQLLDGWSPTEP